ncbi:MAG: DUF5320 domain-containing protein [Syntrophorhabdaceae bacterium]|nr:DUF5320 domain-containing protein [Syntrophorhabdaceae bacterium]
MPCGDGTGPRGFGPMTGRAAGFCTGYGVAGYGNALGERRGGGCRGFRNQFYGTGLTGRQRAGRYIPGWGNSFADGPYYGSPMPAVNRQQETDALKVQAQYLEDALERIRKQLKEHDEKLKGSQGS